MKRALGLAILVNLAAAAVAVWHIARQPLSIESLVGAPAAVSTSGQPNGAAPATPTPEAGGAPRPSARGPAAPRTNGGSPPASVAPRVKPPPVQVREFKREIKRRVSLPPGVRPTQRQVEGVSEEICKAFDRGYRYAQVVDGLKKAGSRYGLGVSAEDARYAIEAAVNSRCPAHDVRLP